ncbi:6-bladed beta-propeller [Cyclobacterium roseum]|uniref:6-bladed beta-propeller n=1 Tax=Cyclobacterium roseum TaxID=2666137 RepID=UPI001391D8C8|nr:6-bladed beta-propeller [Cyclobacterium roseum]
MVGLLFILLGGCNQEPTSVPGLERISVDLSQARTGKLSEFFEPSMDYIWLEDDSEEAQLNTGLQKVLFHQDRIYTLDIFGCKCIHIFNKSGKYMSKIDAYGEGPGQYLDLDDLAVVEEELVLLGVYPRKIMWFSLEGEFLRELSFREKLGPGVFSEYDQRYYLYTPTREPDGYFVKSFDKLLKDELNYFPYDPERFYFEDSGRDYFKKSQDHLYYGMTFWDTIYQVEDGHFIPKLAFDFGKYGQNPDELKNMDDIMQRLDFINNRTKMYFHSRYFLTEKQLYTVLTYENKGYSLFFDRENQKSHVIEGRLLNDIDGGYDPEGFAYNFTPRKIGLNVPGKTLYKELLEKKEAMGRAEFETWAKNQGRNFTTTVLAAKDSENPVLIVYRLK